MLNNHINSKNKLIAKLKAHFSDKLTDPEAEKVIVFADQYYHAMSWEELTEQSSDILYGQVLSCWKHLQICNTNDAGINIYNPDLEQHGWYSPHTIIEIIHPEMPFLVDSVRLELNRQSMAIHHIQNMVLDVSRNSQGRLIKLLDKNEVTEKTSRESLIYIEVDRHTGADTLKDITNGLREVFENVKTVVSDYTAIQQKLREHKKVLSHCTDAETSDLSETQALLDWLLDQHFVFLGYEEIKINQRAETIVRVKNSQLGILRLQNRNCTKKSLCDLNEADRSIVTSPKLLRFAKNRYRSRVHRSAYLDVIVIKQRDNKGEVTGEARLYGYYTAAVYNIPPAQIPVVRQKLSAVLSRSGLSLDSHNGKMLLSVLNSLPREEIFLCNADELFDAAYGIYNMKERRRVRLFMRADPAGQFVSCLYFVPRDIFSSSLRIQVQELLRDYFKAESSEFTTYFSESVLARIHFVFKLNHEQPLKFDVATLENLVVQASFSWDDKLHSALVESLGEEAGNTQATRYKSAFPSAYRDHFSVGNAVYDIQRLNTLSEQQPLAMSFYRVIEQNDNILRFKLYTSTSTMILSDVIPVLENLGMQVLGEHPYAVRRDDKQCFWLHDFTLHFSSGKSLDLQEAKHLFQEAFAAIWKGRSENDGFNRLVMNASLSWREVAIFRAYSRYDQQTRFGFSHSYIAETLVRHKQVTKLLAAFFHARFNPEQQRSDNIKDLTTQIEKKILHALKSIDSLNDDKILRRFLELIKATMRTNYFQLGTDPEKQQGEERFKPYLCYKFDPNKITDLPLPKPTYEVFVYSPRVEGVHLRGGKVARGGLRWSDRPEDYRTEILGLFKAQQVKNAVIVPNGAKGGFVTKRLPDDGDREQILAESIDCYKTFVRALLDITDNLKGGRLVPPENVICHDEDDPYLVVAADKGTATLSDTANGIAAEYDFWLGDAFASGGSQGYDHKGIGITARSAWESVKHHFRNLGHDIHTDPFTVIGIGDMSGDVFGNGMLLSENICLIAAFNHQHIFVDPTPHPTGSFIERQRLFRLPRSSWADYNRDLISKGGGIFLRSSKSIEVSPQMQRCFGISNQRITPAQLISALLKAPVDLIWNGGIGTYVKSSEETHTAVGDRSNDILRVNGQDLKCRVLGEGGNLGFTQLGRVEFDLAGGAVNTDFIDNSGGVDCSDHEVNIKILLNELVDNGDMTRKQRNQLLKDMTEDVAKLVLENSAKQVQIISQCSIDTIPRLDSYIRVIQQLEADGKLDRALEFLPDDEQLIERKAHNRGLTRPELSVLISYTKVEIKKALADSWLPNAPCFLTEMESAFPASLVATFPKQVHQHRLKKEIIATQIANDLVNRTGVTFVHRLKEATGASYADIAATYVITRNLFDLEKLWAQIENLDLSIDRQVQADLINHLSRLIYRCSHWILHNFCIKQDIDTVVDRFKPGIEEVCQNLPDLLRGDTLAAWKEKYNRLTTSGVEESLAVTIANAENYYALLGIIHELESIETPLKEVAAIYFELGDRLDLHWYDQQIANYDIASHWQSLARDCYRDELDRKQRALTLNVLQLDSAYQSAEHHIDSWLDQHQPRIERWKNLLQRLRTTLINDWAIFAVAQNELTSMVEPSQN